MQFPKSQFELLKNCATNSVTKIESQLRARAVIARDATNADRLRCARALVMLNEETDKRFKAYEQSP